MAEQVEIIKQVKLTSAQRIALIAAFNEGGVLRDSAHDVREALRYLGLVEKTPLHTGAELDRLISKAWRDLRRAVRAKNADAAERPLQEIRGERWNREKTCWRLTTAAHEYLLKGRVIVTVGPRNEASAQARLRA
jgi:hypothetical protein